jgi:hypothetical protein
MVAVVALSVFSQNDGASGAAEAVTAFGTTVFASITRGRRRSTTMYSASLAIAGLLARRMPRDIWMLFSTRFFLSRRRDALVTQGRESATGAEDRQA